MARAQGARSQLAGGFESSYGTPPAADSFWRLPFARSTLGSEQPLLENELLGYGRDPLPPVKDAITADGEVVVPIDVRFLGIWLKALFGDPDTTPVAATGAIVFSGQPAPGSIITVNGKAITFVASSPGTDDIEVGATLPDTLNNARVALNGHADTGIDDATYTDDDTATLIITHDTVGPGGNAFTLAASANSNGTVSGPTLSGGGYSHVYVSGGYDLPSLALEVGMPEVPHFAMNVGCKLDGFAWEMRRSGLLTATSRIIAQGETVYAASQAGELEELELIRFGSFNGSISQDGAPIGNIESASPSYSNNLDRIEVIRNDGQIDGADESVANLSGSLTARFNDHDLIDQAVAGTPSELTFGYEHVSGNFAFDLVAHAVYLPRPRVPLEGPQGVRATFNWQAALDASEGVMCTATLLNDVEDYDNPS
jgi:hypothetical protein